MERNELPVAVIDSGVGGVTVLRELVRELPHERFLFFADTKNAPYGTRDRAEVLAITRNNVQTLCTRGIKALVIACNTATGAAAGALREEYDFPIIGIEPAIKMAAVPGVRPSVLVMATPLTLRQEKFLDLKRRFEKEEEITCLPCPGLVELIEAGHTDDETVRTYLRERLATLPGRCFDAVVLGCTHYPLIRPALKAVLGEEVTLLDGSRGTARQTRRRLQEEGLLRPAGEGAVEFLNSRNDSAFDRKAQELLERLNQEAD